MATKKAKSMPSNKGELQKQKPGIPTTATCQGWLRYQKGKLVHSFYFPFSFFFGT